MDIARAGGCEVDIAPAGGCEVDIAPAGGCEVDIAYWGRGPHSNNVPDSTIEQFIVHLVSCHVIRVPCPFP